MLTKRLYILLICLWATIGLSAQELSIDECFNDNVLTRKSVTAVKVKGERLKAYNLTTFRSITVVGDGRTASWVQRMAKLDAKRATDREEGVKDGKLQYAFYVFRRNKGKTYRYIFFRNNKPEQEAVTEVTLVYMEGKATLAEIKQIFK